MSAVELDATTRELLRQAVSNAVRVKTPPPVEMTERERNAERRRRWRENNRERDDAYKKAWRAKRRAERGLPPVNVNVCQKGLHPLAEGNLAGTGKSGKRRCATCLRDYQREFRRRQRAEMTPEQREHHRAKAAAYHRDYRRRKREAA